MAPPPVIDCARVVAYVIVPDDVQFVCKAPLIVDGAPIDRVSRLVICIQLDDASEALLLHCNEDWGSIGAIGGPNPTALKVLAEKNYPGLMNWWVDVDTTVDAALRYCDEILEIPRCSICGRRAFEVERMLELGSDLMCERCAPVTDKSI